MLTSVIAFFELINKGGFSAPLTGVLVARDEDLCVFSMLYV